MNAKVEPGVANGRGGQQIKSCRWVCGLGRRRTNDRSVIRSIGTGQNGGQPHILGFEAGRRTPDLREPSNWSGAAPPGGDVDHVLLARTTWDFDTCRPERPGLLAPPRRPVAGKLPDREPKSVHDPARNRVPARTSPVQHSCFRPCGRGNRTGPGGVGATGRGRWVILEAPPPGLGGQGGGKLGRRSSTEVEEGRLWQVTDLRQAAIRLDSGGSIGSGAVCGQGFRGAPTACTPAPSCVLRGATPRQCSRSRSSRGSCRPRPRGRARCPIPPRGRPAP